MISHIILQNKEVSIMYSICFTVTVFCLGILLYKGINFFEIEEFLVYSVYFKKFVTNSIIEKRRENLNKKNSKF